MGLGVNYYYTITVAGTYLLGLDSLEELREHCSEVLMCSHTVPLELC